MLISNSSIAQGWGQTQKIIASDRELTAEFGYAVAMHGDYAVISARKENDPSVASGAVYVYKNDGNGTWFEVQKLMSPDINANDFFGTSLAMDNQSIIVGARSHDYGGPSSTNTNFLETAGAAYIYEKNNFGTWDFVFKAVAPDRAQFDVFSEAVAISGNYAIIMAPTEDEDENGQNTLNAAGSGYVFKRDGNGDWSFMQKLVITNRDVADTIGRDGSVSIDGTTIVIGGPLEDEDENNANQIINSGAVFIFELDGSDNWIQTQKIVASTRVADYRFGNAVDIDGDFMVVGSPRTINFLGGPAYVFKKVNGIWQEIQQLEPSNNDDNRNFGKTVDIEGNRLVVGAYTEELNNFSLAGAAYVFENDGNDSWNQVARIGALDAETSDYFSFGIAIRGDYIVGGAYREDEDENGQNPLSEAGSAYIFDVNEPNTIPTLSIVEHTLGPVMKVYPNPTKHILNLDFVAYHEAVKITVNNVLGQQVFLENYTNTNTIQIDIENQPRGMYLVEVNVEGTSTSVLKVMKH